MNAPSRSSAGMILVLASLGMLFAAAMLGYLLIRPRFPGATLHLPGALWGSTVLILVSSFTIQRALANVQLERLRAYRVYLAATLALAAGFVILQTPALWQLLADHRVAMARRVGLYGLVFFLVLLHALHVVGGLVALGIISVNTVRGRYDHERFQAVRNATWYWHFLDIVWIVMFSTLKLTA